MYSAPIPCSSSPRSRAARQRLVSVFLEKLVKAFDVPYPHARTTMRQLGEVFERRTSELEQVLSLHVPFGALARRSGNPLGTMLGQRRLVRKAEKPLVDGLEAACDNPDPVAIEIQGPRDSQRLRRHGVAMGVMKDRLQWVPQSRRTGGRARQAPP